MFRKVALILVFSLMMLNVFALEVDQFPENQTQTTAGDVAKLKGELTVIIQKESESIKNVNKLYLTESEERLKELIEEKTNPLIINMPTIILIIILALIWMILKARAKV